MLINISFKEKDEAERFFLVCIIGLTEALLENSISIEDAEKALFSPYSMRILTEKGISENIIELVGLGTELEDIESLLPDKLKCEIQEIKKKAMGELSQRMLRENEMYKMLKGKILEINYLKTWV